MFPKDLLDFVSLVIPVIVALATLFSFGSIFKRSKGPIEVEVEKARQRISDTANQGAPEDKQYLLLREYHAQGLAQSKISFWFSLVFASLGFLVIVSAIFAIDADVSIAGQGRTFVSLVAGTIIDAVAALFFVQSNKARQLMVDFFDRLRNDRKLDESLKLALNISDENLKSRLHAVLALKFCRYKIDGFVSRIALRFNE